MTEEEILRAKPVHIDKERGMYLLNFPEYELDASALIYADTYTTYAYDLIESLNGDRFNLGDYLTRKDFATYYPSLVTEKEFTVRIARYYTRNEMNDLLTDIKDNWTTRTDFNKYKADTKILTDSLDGRITANLNSINNISNVVIPTLLTINDYNNSIANYVTKTDLRTTLESYPTLTKYNEDLQRIRDNASTYNSGNDSRLEAIETNIADMYHKSYIDTTFANHFTKAEITNQNRTINNNIATNQRSITTINSNLQILDNAKLDKTSFEDFKKTVYPRTEMDKIVKDINAYKKPEVDGFNKGLNDRIDDTNKKISDTNVKMSAMYQNDYIDSVAQDINTKIRDNVSAINKVKEDYTLKSMYLRDLQNTNNSLNDRYTKSETLSVIANINQGYFTKTETLSRESKNRSAYDQEIKDYIANQFKQKLPLYVELTDFNDLRTNTYTMQGTKDYVANQLSNYNDKSTQATIDLNQYDKITREYKFYTDQSLTRYTTTNDMNEKFDKYRPKDESDRLLADKLTYYVKAETFNDRLSSVPSMNEMSNLVNDKFNEENNRISNLIETSVNEKVTTFSDYLINNSGIFYTKQIMDHRMFNKEDRSLSLLRFNALKYRIDKFYLKFINYYSKDEIDSMMNYYFGNMNIAKADLYMTREETLRSLNEKVDKVTYLSFFESTYNKTSIDNMMNDRVLLTKYTTDLNDIETKINAVKGSLTTLTTFINGEFSNAINTKVTDLKTELSGNITTNKNKIDNHETRVTAIETRVALLKDENQLNALMDTKVEPLVKKSDYNIEKLTFAKVTDLDTVKNNLSNNYTNKTDLTRNLNEIKGKIIDRPGIENIVDTKLQSYTNSNDLIQVVDDKINNSNVKLEKKITDARETRLSDFTDTTTLIANFETKTEHLKSVNTLTALINNSVSDINNTINQMKSFNNQNYLKLSGGTLSGLLTSDSGVKIGKYLFKDGLSYSDKYLAKVSDTGSVINVVYGDPGVNNINITNKGLLVHTKVSSNGTSSDYNIITEEVFNPFKLTIPTKVEMNTALDLKLDKSEFNTAKTSLQNELVHNTAFEAYKTDISNKFKNEYSTRVAMEKYLADNYVNSTVFNKFKDATNDKINNDLTTKLADQKSKFDQEITKVNTKIDDVKNNIETNITGKISSLDSTYYNKTTMDSKLDEKVDKVSIRDVLRNGTDHSTGSLTIGELLFKDTADGIKYVFDKNGVRINNIDGGSDRVLLSTDISDSKTNMSLGSSGINEINLIGTKFNILDSNGNKSPIVSEKSLNDTVTTKVTEINGRLTLIENNTVDKLNKLEKKVNTEIGTKLNAKLDTSTFNSKIATYSTTAQMNTAINGRVTAIATSLGRSVTDLDSKVTEEFKLYTKTATFNTKVDELTKKIGDINTKVSTDVSTQITDLTQRITTLKTVDLEQFKSSILNEVRDTMNNIFNGINNSLNQLI